MFPSLARSHTVVFEERFMRMILDRRHNTQTPNCDSCSICEYELICSRPFVSAGILCPGLQIGVWMNHHMLIGH